MLSQKYYAIALPDGASVGNLVGLLLDQVEMRSSTTKASVARAARATWLQYVLARIIRNLVEYKPLQSRASIAVTAY
jgi:hypothetical protein